MSNPLKIFQSIVRLIKVDMICSHALWLLPEEGVRDHSVNCSASIPEVHKQITPVIFMDANMHQNAVADYASQNAALI